MKKKIFIVVLAFISLSLTAVAQSENFDVQRNMQKSFSVKGGVGIQQFFTALWSGISDYDCPTPSSSDDGEGSFILDKKNGYASYFDEGAGSLKVKCCYWNRKDGTKLVAFYYDSHEFNESGHVKITSFLQFYVYNAKTKKLDPIKHPFTKNLSGQGHLIVELPRYNKDIKYRFGIEEDMGDFKVLKWNGYEFK